jgi:hypothetical protein
MHRKSDFLTLALGETHNQRDRDLGEHIVTDKSPIHMIIEKFRDSRSPYRKSASPTSKGIGYLMAEVHRLEEEISKLRSELEEFRTEWRHSFDSVVEMKVQEAFKRYEGLGLVDDAVKRGNVVRDKEIDFIRRRLNIIESKLFK